MRDLYHSLGAVFLYEPQDQAGGDTASSLLDLQGFEGATVAVLVGALTGVDATHYLVPTLQESDTTAAADFTDVAAADILGAFTKIDAAAEDSVVQMVGYRGNSRYIRVNCDYTNPGAALSAGIVGVLGIVGHARREPVTAPAAVAAT